MLFFVSGQRNRRSSAPPAVGSSSPPTCRRGGWTIQAFFFSGDFWEFSIEDGWFRGIYPLVNIQKAVENHHFQWENPLFLWSFSIAMLVYQRVTNENDFRMTSVSDGSVDNDGLTRFDVFSMGISWNATCNFLDILIINNVLGCTGDSIHNIK